MDKEQCRNLKVGDFLEYHYKEWWEKMKVLENDVTNETIKYETVETDYRHEADIGFVDTIAYDSLIKEHPLQGHCFYLSV